MKQKKASVLVASLVLVYCLFQLIHPLLAGRSPVDLGVDLKGGVIVSYRPDFSRPLPGYAGAGKEELLELAKETLTSRLSHRFSTVPEVVIRGDQRIDVTLPTEKSQQEVLELIGRTYHLTLRLVSAGPVEKSPFVYQGRFYELDDAKFSGDMLQAKSIRVQTKRPGPLDLRPPEATVVFRFQPPHDEEFERFTGANVGRELAILVDDEVEWIGRIESAIPGTGTLRGGYSLEEATSVAQLLKSGTLPISLKVASVEAVGPSLGQEIQEMGLHALGISFLLLAALIAVAYHGRRDLLLAGLASLVALLLLLVGMVSAFGLTLDVAGIAGIVLSIGMGMDAFLLVFESLARRSRDGRPESLVRGAYSFLGDGRTLFHANATTLVVILLLLLTERLKSFALFMFVGILASVVTIFLTRALLQRLRGLSARSFDAFAGLRAWRPGLFRFRGAYFALLAAGLLLTVALSFRQGPPLELGADFREGTKLVVRSEEEKPIGLALDELSEQGVTSRRQTLGSEEDGRYVISLDKTLSIDSGGDGMSPRDLRAAFTRRGVEVESMTSIDGKVSSQRLAQSLWVLVLSFVLLAGYFAGQGTIERFFSSRARPVTTTVGERLTVFGGVLLAVVLDVLVVFMSLVLLKVQVNLPVVAALLTIVGYSVNDSVVLWSHVEKRRAEGTGESPWRIVAESVDEVLSRTLLTSFSTMVPALVILGVGLGPLMDFARVMVVGTVAGTASSIFVVGSFAVRALSASPVRSGRQGVPYVLADSSAAVGRR